MGTATLNTTNWESACRLFQDGGLSVILPCHNLADKLTDNLLRLNALLEPLGFPYELIPVDDGSTDASAVILNNEAALCPAIHPVYLNENEGKGEAFRAGAQAAQYNWVLLLDGDLDLCPEALPAFTDVAERTDAAIIIGSKRHPQAEVNYPLRRRLISTLYHTFTRLFLRLPVSDTQSGMKLLRREVLHAVCDRMLVKQFAFDLEVLAIAQSCGYTIAEAPVRIADFGRRWGCISFRTLWRTFIDTLAILYRARFLHYYATLAPLTPPTDGPKFSIIVACPGDSTVLRRLIDALKEQTYRNFEVIFLPDRLLVRPETNFRFRILATGSVRPAKKRNMGSIAATGDILAFIDDDAYPRPDWLANAAARFASSLTERRAESGERSSWRPDKDPASNNGLFPVEASTDNPPSSMEGLSPNATAHLRSPLSALRSNKTIDALGGPGLTPPDDPYEAQLSGLIFASPLVSGNFRYRYFIQGALRRIEDFPSCNLFVRKSTFDEIKGFREDFWPGEDTLLCADLQRAGHDLWYDPRIVVYHHRRPVFLPHLRQVGRYALHRGYFARRIGHNSRRLSYLIPSLFVLGLIGGLPLAFLYTWCAITYASTILFYILLTLADALIEAPNRRFIFPLWTGIILTHLWYGVRFLQGLISLRMPCGVRPFDHR